MQAPPVLLSDREEDIFSSVMPYRSGGILSSRPIPKKVKATSGLAIPVDDNFDVFGSSDLSDIDSESESMSPPDDHARSPARSQTTWNSVDDDDDDPFGSDLTDIEDLDPTVLPGGPHVSGKKRRR